MFIHFFFVILRLKCNDNGEQSKKESLNCIMILVLQGICTQVVLVDYGETSRRLAEKACTCENTVPQECKSEFLLSLPY